MPWPTEVRLAKDKRTLTVDFDDGSTHSFAAELLRVFSPSAEVRGHSRAQRKIVPGKRDVQIIAIEPVGNYAVRLTFDDMHNTGIFSWGYLLTLAAERESLWEGYLAELAAAGLGRQPIGRR